LKRNFKLLAVLVQSILAGLVLKADRGHGQGGQQSPIIIRQLSLENQTITPPQVYLFTPTTSGLFRVNAYFSVFPGSTGSLCPWVTWRDASAYQFAGLSSCAYGGGNANGAVIVHSIPNESVNLSLNASGFSCWSECRSGPLPRWFRRVAPTATVAIDALDPISSAGSEASFALSSECQG
jgi:hypothetical protein